MKRVPVPDVLKSLSTFFCKSNYKLYLVGGAVRDMILGKTPQDWDVATNATPEQVTSLFKRVIPTGIAHGTVTIPFKGNLIECTTFRIDEGYSDGRRPDAILYAANIEDDLSRRDFTMNAIAVSLPDGHIVDPFNGENDIHKKLIRTVGSAPERFLEDGLRPVRAVRFAAQLGFSIDPDTLSAIPGALSVTTLVAQERIHDELVKLLSAPQPSIGLRYMEQTGLLRLLIPELQACRGVEQKGMHRFDVLDHLLYACDASSAEQPEVRLAALFHDIGKPQVRNFDEFGSYTFYNHEKVSAEITRAVMTRLRFSTKSIKEVCHLVRQHMFHYEPSWTDAAVRRFIARVGKENIAPLFELRRADSCAIVGKRVEPAYLPELQRRINEILNQEQAFCLKDIAVNGRDLISAGIPVGPKIGLILNELLETVIDDPNLNTHEKLLEIARAIYQNRFLSDI